MRITASDRYVIHDIECDLYLCERNYCKSHRTLYRDCETATLTRDGAGQPTYDLRDCPSCVQESLRRSLYATPL